MARRYALRIATRAQHDILQAKAWLTQPGSGSRGSARYSRINRALLDLKDAPLRWPVGDYGMRERPVEGHCIFYQVDEAARRVAVIRVYGPFQDRLDL
ncbi:MAG: type II toxin-antitoxin system RelE/ParE family toxin [Candidatus Brevundimonas colombiensis]|uniref:Type II toxin-antitoxin system RelE/ParE family toxin n=1 Tax=Candidatus Brevundimonas colombiensis TaxID=3121376 RepID=A0AAJ6BK50_9CAUL|nr:type II toxin-antitoxin system RelE/ParE family toxin [Brevundimonas sp.]WEK38629.1 MAG: type II toxin-antitoxin system RelE/ParE family toxin [Brevundimonas sp.]